MTQAKKYVVKVVTMSTSVPLGKAAAVKAKRAIDAEIRKKHVKNVRVSVIQA